MTTVRQPSIFIPHGGGPCFWMEFPPPFGPHAWDGLRGDDIEVEICAPVFYDSKGERQHG